MGLLLLDAKLGQQLEDLIRLDLQLPRQLIDSDLNFIDKNCLKKDRATTYSVFRTMTRPQPLFRVFKFSRFILIHLQRLLGTASFELIR